MKFHFESEVIIPSAVFDYVSSLAVQDLLSGLNVKFECKGKSDVCCEFLLTSSSRWCLQCAIDLFYSLRRFFQCSLFSVPDGFSCESWSFGSIRIVFDD